MISKTGLDVEAQILDGGGMAKMGGRGQWRSSEIEMGVRGLGGAGSGAAAPAAPAGQGGGAGTGEVMETRASPLRNDSSRSARG